ncbi:MAG: deoxyribodipyrimidine photolyase, partial [Actinomycetes bacterium]
GFARWQVEKRAPGLCERCPLANACPIQEFPEEETLNRLDVDSLLERDLDPEKTSGPTTALKVASPKYVLLTIDSMGDNDPALVANPDLTVVFVFNEEALQKLQLSSKRLGFYLETVQDLAQRRTVQVYLGDPYQFASDNPVAVTFAPVPSFKKFSSIAEIHPYPWLQKPHSGSVKSYSALRKST